MAGAPTAESRYAPSDRPNRREFTSRRVAGLALAVSGAAASLVAAFIPFGSGIVVRFASGDDFTLARDSGRLTLTVFVAVAVAFAVALLMIFSPDPVAPGLLAGVGVVETAYFVGWIANLDAFSAGPGAGAFLGVGGGVLMVIGGAVLLDFRERRTLGEDTWADQDTLIVREAQSPEAVGASKPSAAPQAPQEQPSAGWYPDPAGRARLRYWTGATWTENTQD